MVYFLMMNAIAELPGPVKSKRRVNCPPAGRRQGTKLDLRRQRQRHFTTCSVFRGAMDLMQVALPWTSGQTGPSGKESATEFITLAIAERVGRLKDEKGFTLPPGLSVAFDFTDAK